METIFGFIGTGNMGGALAKAAAATLPGENILLADRFAEKAQQLAEKLSCRTGSVADAARTAKYLFLGVKPQMMADLFTEIAPVLAARTDTFVLVSMAAGLTIGDIRRMAGADYPVIRIMPNMAVSVGAGVVMYDVTENVTEQQVSAFCTNMAAAGILDRLPEKLIDAGSAVAGCGPAFAALFVEALADGGVACGLPRDKAMQYAAATMEGTAKLLLETGMHPGALKDAVCSPGGTTIAGVRALEQGGFRASAIDAVDAAYRRTLELKP